VRSIYHVYSFTVGCDCYNERTIIEFKQLRLFSAALAAVEKRTAGSERKNSKPAKAGEFPYGTYQTFALQMWLGA